MKLILYSVMNPLLASSLTGAIWNSIEVYALQFIFLTICG